MKPQEILLASAVIALVGGAGAALATRAFVASSERLATGQGDRAQRDGARRVEAEVAADPSSELEDLRQSQTALLQRIAALESRLAEVQNARTAAAPERALEEKYQTTDALLSALQGSSEAPLELTPEFVASVERALTRIQDAEQAERDKTRKEQQAQRIEERVTRLQQELGLNNRQTSDLRTALITQDEKREALFTSMREGNGDPSTMRESFRTLRDDAQAELQRILTPAQYTAYQASEESEFGRRGFGDFGPRDFGQPGGRPPERDGRPR